MMHFLFSEKKLKFVSMQRKPFDKGKVPVVHIDNSLEKYKGKPISKEKLDKANEMLKTTGLPKTEKHP